ncbi:hypothetical protein TMatcc_005624 [Talaromyces marneffei ATCC 18224]|uniref:uncharacterized protein n=1 Tax=Talaromyces marneffei TaxID=37727 RepID=UPI0012A8D9AE|nr:uncharacterized protein EYB26_005857 [Talaromyces marneffei]KAE8554832.1 hypothetical protein EYB25_003379 [Talaromyces marneffei]QGA18173.1 hypothetical protein EYB26_005857 [Talaromyces marneffei]
MSTHPTSRPNSSRRGCWTCKRRHRTCDETKPFCLRCRQYAVECEGYGVKRVAFRSAKKKNTNKDDDSENSHQPLTTVTGTSPFPSTSSEISSPSLYSPLSNPVILSSTPIDYHQRRLLNHFLSDFAPLRSLSPLQNIFEEDIAPLALGHHHVRTAIVAVISALQQGRHSTPHPQMRHSVNAFQHYEEAVRLLRQSVDRFEKGQELISSSQGNSTDDMHACLAAAYLLTWFEVLVYDPQKWVIHLEALCGLINRSGPSLIQTTFGRRLVHAVARLDCQNALSNRGRPLLDNFWYETLESDIIYMPITVTDNMGYMGFTETGLEAMAVEYCRNLHGLLGAAAFLSYEWTSDTPRVTGDSLRERVLHVLNRLFLWYRSLPIALRWPEDIGSNPINIETLSGQEHFGDFYETETTFSHEDTHDINDRQLRRRTHLQKMILLHYYAIRVHLYHILDPVRTPRLMQLSINLAQKCLYIIRALDNNFSFPTSRAEDMATQGKKKTSTTNKTPHNTKPSQYPSDMPVSFVFACIGVVLRDPSQREWISKYLMQLGREGIWCGYERALCLHAWWRSDNAITGYGEETPNTKRLIKSIPHRHEVPNGSLATWTPEMGMGVDILYENLATGETGFDRYHFSGYIYIHSLEQRTGATDP